MNNLFFRQSGKGRPLLFIHGFPFHSGVWDEFAGQFINDNLVITPDLPGFGKSPILPEGFNISDVADCMLQFLSEQNIHGCVLIGHSLGGYVALSMIEKKPEIFSALGLFHSTAYPDSAEKKTSRNKVVEFVEKNGAKAFATNFITQLFADPTHPAIEKVKQIAASSPMDAVIGYTRAMRDRTDQVKTLKSFKKPTLFIAGDKDPGIPVDTVYRQASDCQYPEIHVLSGVAHLAMFERPEEAASKIKGFLDKI